MKFLNFIPLLVWALAFMPTVAICEKIEGKPWVGKSAEGAALIYLIGCVTFFFIGVFCCA